MYENINISSTIAGSVKLSYNDGTMLRAAYCLDTEYIMAICIKQIVHFVLHGIPISTIGVALFTRGALYLYIVKYEWAI